MKKFLALLLLAALPAFGVTNYLATAPATNSSFFLADTNVITVGSGIWTWTTTVGLFRSNLMRLGGVTGPLNVAGLTNTAQVIQTPELDVLNIVCSGAAMSIYAGSSSGILYDYANAISVDWKNHKLYDANQRLIADFSNTNNFDVSAQITARLFTGPGTGLTSLPAASLTGSINDARLSANVSLLGSSISEGEIALTDVTTANASTSAHGFVKKLPNDATKFYDGTGNYSTPPLLNYTSQTATGAGSGSTNYVLSVSTNSINDFYLGSSNVNFAMIVGQTAGSPIYWNAYVTNLSADTWGIGFSAVTNRWRFAGVYGTNAPLVLTNNTCLMLSGRSDGSNTLVGYTYFSPGL